MLNILQYQRKDNDLKKDSIIGPLFKYINKINKENFRALHETEKKRKIIHLMQQVLALT